MERAQFAGQVVTLSFVVLTSWLNAALDYCFPGACAACKSTCEGRLPLCPKCMAQLDALAAAPACQHCAAPLAYADAPCPHCLNKGSPLLERVVAIGLFDDPLRQMIHAVKYHRAWPLAEYLADRLLANSGAQTLLMETNLLVPVPLHFSRQLSRGYNQAALIARRLHHRCNILQAEPLARVRATATQTQLHSMAKRNANLQGAFAMVNGAALRGKHVLLVDDVMTTGATLRAAARELGKSKPASISALVIAVADPRQRHFERA